MEKTFTLFDLTCYLNEIRLAENFKFSSAGKKDGPCRSTVQNILRYSAALNVLKTKAAGPVYHLAN